MKSYKLLSNYTATNNITGETKDFSAGDVVSGTVKTTIGSFGILVSPDGYLIPSNLIEETSAPVWLFAGLGVAFLVVAFVLVKLFKKQ